MSNRYNICENFIRSPRVNSLGSQDDRPLCSGMVPYYNVERLPTVGWRNDCESAWDDPMLTWNVYGGGVNREEARSKCSLYYNDPLIGSAKICNGEPKLHRSQFGFGDTGYWVCQAGTECRT